MSDEAFVIPIERTREAWKRAGKFPPNKEIVYPDHRKAQEFDQNSNKRVLEYGCGGGSDAMSYLRRQCTVWYVDVVPENVRTATARIAGAGLDKRAYGYTLDQSVPLPVGDAYFQIVSSHGVLHHLVDPMPVLAEFRRVLARDGVLYVMLYTEHLWEKFRLTVEQLMRDKRCATWEEAFCWCTDGEGTPYSVYYKEPAGKELLERAGFSVVSTFDYNHGDFRTYKAVKA